MSRDIQYCVGRGVRAGVGWGLQRLNRDVQALKLSFFVIGQLQTIESSAGLALPSGGGAEDEGQDQGWASSLAHPLPSSSCHEEARLGNSAVPPRPPKTRLCVL